MQRAISLILTLLLIEGCEQQHPFLLYNSRDQPIVVESSDTLPAGAKSPEFVISPHTLKAVESNCRITCSGKSLYYTLQMVPPDKTVDGKELRYCWREYYDGILDWGLPTPVFAYVLGPDDRLYVAPVSLKAVLEKGGPIDWQSLAHLQPTQYLPIPGYPTYKEAAAYGITGDYFGARVQTDVGLPKHHIVFVDAPGWPTIENLTSGVNLPDPLQLPSKLTVTWQDDDGSQHSKSFNLLPVIPRPELFHGFLTLWFTKQGLRLFVVVLDGDPNGVWIEGT